MVNKWNYLTVSYPTKHVYLWGGWSIVTPPFDPPGASTLTKCSGRPSCMYTLAALNIEP
jgi:hypothetical protein